MTPFATGYTEAALAELNGRRYRATNDGLDPYTVDDLAPATLSRIIADCEAFTSSRAHDHGGDRRAKGAALWKARNAIPNMRGFPPLTVTLGDEGLIYLAEAGQ